jgi:hypothetical protein
MITVPPRRALPLALVLAAAALAGCSASRGYPSLAPRAIERPDNVAAEAAPAPQPAVDAALDAQISALGDQARDGDAAFRRAIESACPALTRGAAAAEGSEPWIAGQQALSALEAARAPMLGAAAELDRLTLERGSGDARSVDLDRLTAAQAEVSALDADEQARLAAAAEGRCG